MNRFGFPIDKSHRFRIDNQWHRISSDGVEALKLLQQLYDASVAANDKYWALRMRPQIQKIQSLNVRPALTLVIKTTVDERMRLLAIWLRGRCGGYVGTSTIASFAYSGTLETQKECVRALQRLSGWAELRKIAGTTEHARIRKLAAQRQARPLNERLTSMMENIQPIPRAALRKQIWLRPGIVLDYAAPKSIDIMRQILHRIKRIVSSSSGSTGKST